MVNLWKLIVKSIENNSIFNFIKQKSYEYINLNTVKKRIMLIIHYFNGHLKIGKIFLPKRSGWSFCNVYKLKSSE